MQTSAVSIIESMILQQCANKGFDAVETDLDKTYDNNEGTTLWTITEANEQTYLTTLADYMHSLGLGWIAKDLDDTGDGFAGIMEPLASGIITEQCNQDDTCGQLTSYEGHVAVLNVEYESSLYPGFCTYDEANGINGALFKADLDGPLSPCPGPASPAKASTTITTSLSGGGQTGTSTSVPVDTPSPMQPHSPGPTLPKPPERSPTACTRTLRAPTGGRRRSGVHHNARRHAGIEPGHPRQCGHLLLAGVVLGRQRQRSQYQPVRIRGRGGDRPQTPP